MKRFSTHFRIAWWQYMLVILASAMLWTTVYTVLNKPDANEKLTVSYFGSDYDWKTMKDALQRDLSGITEQYIEEITFDYVSDRDNSAFGQMIQTRLFASDILIFNEGTVTEEFIQNSFPPMAEQLFAGVDEALLYKVGGVPYGILLTDTPNRFSACYTGTERCIAFFGPWSENIGAAYGQGDPADDAAISLLYYLLENIDGESESE